MFNNYNKKVTIGDPTAMNTSRRFRGIGPNVSSSTSTSCCCCLACIAIVTWFLTSTKSEIYTSTIHIYQPFELPHERIIEKAHICHTQSLSDRLGHIDWKCNSVKYKCILDGQSERKS